MQNLLRLYAMRAREFSDAAARLGEHHHGGLEFLALITEIKKRLTLCISIGQAIDQCIERDQPATHHAGPEHSPGDLATQINEARQAMVLARGHYKLIDKEFRVLTSQARDVGLNHPDGIMAMGIAARNLNSALEQYHAAVGRLTQLLSEVKSARLETENSSPSAGHEESLR